jgi:hypothetical protein
MSELVFKQVIETGGFAGLILALAVMAFRTIWPALHDLAKRRVAAIEKQADAFTQIAELSRGIERQIAEVRADVRQTREDIAVLKDREPPERPPARRPVRHAS